VDEIEKFKTQVLQRDESDDNDCLFNFNKIIPMPKILEHSLSGSTSNVGSILLLMKDQYCPELPGHIAKEVRAHCSLKSLEVIQSQHIYKYLKDHPDMERDGLLYLKCLSETGYCSWYEWSRAKWGTKWNSCGTKIVNEEELEFVFDTAWAFPEPIFEKLNEMFPALHFYCACFDEGWGFAGEGYFNPPEGESNFRYYDMINLNSLYERVYGHPVEKNEEE
jgi:hypothetical protein